MKNALITIFSLCVGLISFNEVFAKLYSPVTIKNQTNLSGTYSIQYKQKNFCKTDHGNFFSYKKTTPKKRGSCLITRINGWSLSGNKIDGYKSSGTGFATFKIINNASGFHIKHITN